MHSDIFVYNNCDVNTLIIYKESEELIQSSIGLLSLAQMASVTGGYKYRSSWLSLKVKRK